MSALPPEADMLIVGINVCFVPEADIKSVHARKVPCGPGAHQLPLASHILPVPVILAPRPGAALHFTTAKDQRGYG